MLCLHISTWSVMRKGLLWRHLTSFSAVTFIACVAWRFCRAGRTSGEAAKFAREARENERRSREKNKVASAPISSRFLCPRPPLLLSAPNQNRHATQAMTFKQMSATWKYKACKYNRFYSLLASRDTASMAVRNGDRRLYSRARKYTTLATIKRGKVRALCAWTVSILACGSPRCSWTYHSITN